MTGIYPNPYDSPVPGELELQVLKNLVFRNAKKFNFMHLVEDIYQDLVVQIIASNYLMRYNRENNSIQGYLSVFVFNHFCKIYKRSKSPVGSAAPLEEEVQVLEKPINQVFDLRISVEEVLDWLEEAIPCSSGALYYTEGAQEIFRKKVAAGYELKNGEKVYWRSAAYIFFMYCVGKDTSEIAEQLHVSQGWVLKIKERSRKEIVALVERENTQ